MTAIKQQKSNKKVRMLTETFIDLIIASQNNMIFVYMSSNIAMPLKDELRFNSHTNRT
jgi:hypothetical protein